MSVTEIIQTVSVGVGTLAVIVGSINAIVLIVFSSKIIEAVQSKVCTRCAPTLALAQNAETISAIWKELKTIDGRVDRILELVTQQRSRARGS